jgi:hypothetical protein
MFDMVLLDYWPFKGQRKDDGGWRWGYLYRSSLRQKGPFYVRVGQTVSYQQRMQINAIKRPSHEANEG